MNSFLHEYGDFLILMIFVSVLVGMLNFILNGLYLGESTEGIEDFRYGHELKSISIYRNDYNEDDGGSVTGLNKYYDKNNP